MVLVQLDEDEDDANPYSPEGAGAKQIEINHQRFEERKEIKEGVVKPGDLKVLTANSLKDLDPERFKEDIAGKAAGKFNITEAPNGDLFLVPVSAGTAPSIATGYTYDQFREEYSK